MKNELERVVKSKDFSFSGSRALRPADQARGPVRALFRRTDWVAFLITLACVWLGYFLTLAPELTLEDSG
jgi:hypothetical protein